MTKRGVGYGPNRAIAWAKRWRGGSDGKGWAAFQSLGGKCLICDHPAWNHAGIHEPACDYLGTCTCKKLVMAKGAYDIKPVGYGAAQRLSADATEVSESKSETHGVRRQE